MSHGSIPSVDVVLHSMSPVSGEAKIAIRPFEIKLTVLPDSTTSKLTEENWGSEIVIRPQTIKYCCLSLAANNRSIWSQIIAALNPLCQRVSNWSSESDVIKHLDNFIGSMDLLLRHETLQQTPLLLNPIWKTKGHSSLLEDDAFDFFVWTDAALVKLIIEQSRKIKAKVSRPQRALLQIAHALNELSTGRAFNINAAFDSISYSQQSDKALAVAGGVTSNYYPSKYVLKPRIPKAALPEIILGNGHLYLKPERRFDATVCFQSTELFKNT